MNRRRNLSLCVVLTVFISTIVYAGPVLSAKQISQIRRPTTRHRRPTHMNQPLMETSRLILRSARTVEKVEVLLISLHDLAKQSATGSYSAFQRGEMNIDFQNTLATLDPMIEQATYKERNMLDSADEIIFLNIRRETLEFPCVNITAAGLGLDVQFDISTPMNAMTAYSYLEATIRQMMEVDFQFTDYINTLAKYTPHIKPILNKETQQALEIIEASKEAAESIVERLNRTLDLIGAVRTGAYSDQQMMIMNNEFEQMLIWDNLIGNIYYGLGIIDSTDILVVDTGRDILRFQCLDLTSTAVGLDVELSIATPEEAQNASPYIIVALESVEQAIGILDEYIATLTEHLQPEKEDYRKTKTRINHQTRNR